MHGAVCGALYEGAAAYQQNSRRPRSKAAAEQQQDNRGGGSGGQGRVGGWGHCSETAELERGGGGEKSCWTAEWGFKSGWGKGARERWVGRDSNRAAADLMRGAR